MGKLLVVSGADFAENGMSLVNLDEEKLNKIKQVLAQNFYEGVRYGSPYADGVPGVSSNNRDAFGGINASSFDSVPFILTPKTGCKIAPVQNSTNPSSTRWALSWTTNAVTFDSFATYPYIGGNLAYTDDSILSSGKTIWDFVDIALVPEES